MGRCVRYTGVFLHQRTHLRTHSLCTYVYMYICVCMRAYAHGCVCASMILLDTLRRCCQDFLSVHTCAYACVCICVCMYVCIVHVYMYVYVYMYDQFHHLGWPQFWGHEGFHVQDRFKGGVVVDFSSREQSFQMDD